MSNAKDSQSMFRKAHELSFQLNFAKKTADKENNKSFCCCDIFYGLVPIDRRVAFCKVVSMVSYIEFIDVTIR